MNRDGGRLLAGRVLDVETVPDPDAVALAPRGAVRGGARRYLHRVVCATILAFTEDPDTGEMARLSMRSTHAGDMPEAAILVQVEDGLADPGDAHARLATFNGMVHDLPVLVARAMALWMFDLPRLRGWEAVRDERHVDLCRTYAASRQGRTSLPEVCASFGLPLKGADTGVNAARLAERGDYGAIARKNQEDVLATFLAYAYRNAWRRGCDRPVASAWTCAGDFLARAGGRLEHLGTIRHHHLVALAHARSAAFPRPEMVDLSQNRGSRTRG